MKRWRWIAILWHGLLAAALAAASQTQIAAPLSPVRVAHMSRDASGVSLHLQLEQPTWEMVNRDSQNLIRADFSDGGLLARPGEPAVPVASRFFRLPASGGASVEVVNADYQTMSDVEYAAFVGEGDNDPTFGPLTSMDDAWYPEHVAEVTPAAIFHDFRIASLVTYPVQVNPARREVRIYSNLDVHISYNNQDHTNELSAWPTMWFLCTLVKSWSREILKYLKNLILKRVNIY